MIKIKVDKSRIVNIIDEYGLFVVAIFFSFGFSLYSSAWIYKSLVIDKLGFAFTLVLLPLFIVGVQVILKSKSSENTEAENDLKIFNFFYNIFISIISLIRFTLPFNFATHLAVTLLMLPILGTFFYVVNKFEHSTKSTLITANIVLFLIYIVNIFRPIKPNLPGRYIFTIIMVLSYTVPFLILFLLFLTRYIKKKRKQKTFFSNSC